MGGTIKKRPSIIGTHPKLPLTNTTRGLVRDSEDDSSSIGKFKKTFQGDSWGIPGRFLGHSRGIPGEFLENSAVICLQTKTSGVFYFIYLDIFLFGIGAPQAVIKQP